MRMQQIGNATPDPGRSSDAWLAPHRQQGSFTSQGRAFPSVFDLDEIDRINAEREQRAARVRHGIG